MAHQSFGLVSKIAGSRGAWWRRWRILWGKRPLNAPGIQSSNPRWRTLQVFVKRLRAPEIELSKLRELTLAMPSHTEMNRPPNLDELERQVVQETRRRETDTLARIEVLLNAFLPAFRETGRFTPMASNRREQAWWLLVGQSFNSLRWAFHLL